jgi:lipid-A-disaccharide synthase
LQRQANPAQLGAALASLIADTPERRDQLNAFARLDAIMGIGTVIPSEKAASIVIERARRGRDVLSPQRATQ